MDTLITLLLFQVGWLIFPATLVFSLSQQPNLIPIPTPASTPLATQTPSLTPTNTVTPTETPTPKPTNTPTPSSTPTPTPIPLTSGQLDEWFTKYSSHYSVDRQKLWRVAVCESNLRINARNGDYGGLYQFSTGTWKTTRRHMNMDTNPDLRFNPEEAIRTAAFKMSTAGLSPWPNCGK